MLPSNAVRLAALVAAAMTSGYLWRGAVEVRKPTEVLRSAAPAIAFELPDAPFSSLGHLRVRVPRKTSPAVKRRVVTRKTPRHIVSARRSGDAEPISAVEAPSSSAGHAARPKRSSHARAATPMPQPPAKSRPPAPTPPVAPPPPPPVRPSEPTPPPPAGVKTGPCEGKKEKKEKKPKREKQPKAEKQPTMPKRPKVPKQPKADKPPKAEKQPKDEKSEKRQRKEKGNK